MAVASDANFVEMQLGKVFSDRSGDKSFVVVLDGVSTTRRLAIQIGSAEALLLLASLDGREFPRPMGPHFAASLLQALGGRVRQVRIDRLIPIGGGTAYGSTVVVEGGAGTVSVDARPSDALNLAALVHAPIFVAPEVLAEAAGRLEYPTPEAGRLRLALESEPMHLQRPDDKSE
jgi:bifunctional DNase/RNase